MNEHLSTKTRAIDLVGVSKIYQRRRYDPVNALDETTLSIAPGQFVSLVGPSGCGKTTLLRIVAGLLIPTTGMATLDGQTISASDPRISMVFQRPTLLRWRTVLENVYLPLRINGWLNDETRARAAELLERTGLGGVGERHPRELSGGMQQRVAICRALVTNPSVLLMDEPFSALDEFTREDLNDLLLELWEGAGMTVLFVTHNIAEAVYLSDEIHLMTSGPGRVLATERIDLERPRSEQTRVSAELLEHVRRIRGQIGPAARSESGNTSEAGVGAD